MKIKPDLYLKGVFMGIAEIIPGVSGGTIAFITGIYEELIDSIKSVNSRSLKLLLTLKFASFWRAINGSFLITYSNFWNVVINFDSFKIHCLFNR